MELKFASDDASPEDESGAAPASPSSSAFHADDAPELTDDHAAPAPASDVPPLEESGDALSALGEIEAELLEKRSTEATGAELAEVLGRLAAAQAKTGMGDDALAAYREGAEALRGGDDYAARAALIAARAGLERELGKFVDAQRSYAEAAQAFAMARDEKSCADCWYGVGDMRVLTNRASGAVEAYEQAARLYGQAGATLEQAHATYLLAAALRESQQQRAVMLFAQARDLYGGSAAAQEGAAQLPEVVDDPRSLPTAVMAAACERERRGLEEAGVSPEAPVETTPSWTRAEATAKKKTPLPLLVAAALAVLVALYAALAPSPEQGAVGKPAEVYRPPSVASGELREMPAPARKRAEGLLASAAAASSAGNYDEAVIAYDEAIAMFRRGKRREGEVDGLLGRAELEMARGRPDEARRFYLELIGVQHDLGDTAGQMRILEAIVAIDRASGSATALRDSYGLLLALHEQLDDRDGQVETLHDLIALEQAEGQLGAAREVLTRLRLLYDSIGDVAGKAATLENLAAIDMQVGRVARARDQLNQAFVIYRESGAAADQARALVGLGDIDRGEKRPEQARASYRQALRLYEDGGDVTGQMATRLRLGDIERDLNHVKRAATIYDEVLRACESSGDERCVANALLHEGRLLAAAGDAGQAVAIYTRAAELLARIGGVGERVEVLVALAELHGGGAEAERLWEEAARLSAGLDDPGARAAALGTIAAAAAHSGRAAAARDGYAEALQLYQASHNVVGQMAVLRALQGLTRGNDAALSRRYEAELMSLQTATDASLRD